MSDDVFIDASNAVGSAIQYASRICGQESERAGWRSDIDPKNVRDVASLLALTASEIGETEDVAPETALPRLQKIRRSIDKLLEAVRMKGRPMSTKIPGFTAEEEEAADVQIRHLDYCQLRELRIGEAVAAKLRYNRTRSTRHGKTF